MFIIFIFIFNFYFIIQVQGNPLNSIPNEMISLDNFDLFKWIKNFPKENNLMNYFHLVVVGDEKSGKSRLISSLVGNDYKQKQDNETMGIILNDWTYQQKENSTSFFSVKINFLFFIYFQIFYFLFLCFISNFLFFIFYFLRFLSLFMTKKILNLSIYFS